MKSHGASKSNTLHSKSKQLTAPPKMSKNMFAALNDEEEEQVHVEQQTEPPKPVKLFTVEDMANEQKEIERQMAAGLSWYDIFMRDDEEKRWREEAKFGKSDDWTDICPKKIQQKPRKVKASHRHG